MFHLLSLSPKFRKRIEEVRGFVMSRDTMPRCDYPGCDADGTTVSRLSPEGYLVATGKKAYSFREAYRRFHYCGDHHEELMGGVWSRVRKPDDKKDGHVAPTAI